MRAAAMARGWCRVMRVSGRSRVGGRGHDGVPVEHLEVRDEAFGVEPADVEPGHPSESTSDGRGREVDDDWPDGGEVEKNRVDRAEVSGGASLGDDAGHGADDAHHDRVGFLVETAPALGDFAEHDGSDVRVGLPLGDEGGDEAVEFVAGGVRAVMAERPSPIAVKMERRTVLERSSLWKW